MLLVLTGGIATGQSRQQGQIRFTTAPQRWRLRRLQGLSGELERLVGRIGLPQQDQSSNLSAGSEIEPSRLAGMVLA